MMETFLRAQSVALTGQGRTWKELLPDPAAADAASLVTNRAGS